MGVGTALLASSVMQAGMQVYSGYQKQDIAEYQASLYEQKAGQIEHSKKLEAYQYERKKRQYAGKLVSRVAKSGLEFSGSPADVLVDGLTQLELDQEIGQYNLELEKQYALSTASEYKYKGKVALHQGYGGAFQTMLNYGVQRSLLKQPSGTGTGGYGEITSTKSSPYYPQSRTSYHMQSIR